MMPLSVTVWSVQKIPEKLPIKMCWKFPQIVVYLRSIENGDRLPPIGSCQDRSSFELVWQIDGSQQKA